MDEKELLASVWSWLPAFKSVAEVEHLPTASKRLAVTSSELSRSSNETIRAVIDAVRRQVERVDGLLKDFSSTELGD